MLCAPDLERVLAVVEGVEDQPTALAFREATLELLDRELSYARTTFFLTGPPVAGTVGTDGVQRGFARRVMDEYVDRFSDDDVFRSAPATAILRRDGLASLDELGGRLDDRGRRYVDRFLRPHAIAAQLTVWLDTRLPTHGILCVLGHDDREFSQRDRALLLALRPHLSNLLAHQLRECPEPRPDVPLSAREREVARLVADGSTNREIAVALGLSEDTVKKHVSSAIRRLGVRNRTELALSVRRTA